MRRSKFLRARDTKKANSEYDKIHRLKDAMRGLPDRGAAALKRIAQSEDLWVKMSAAAALLAVDERHAIAILKGVAKSPGLESLSAEMTIQEWLAGNLMDYWG